MAKPRVTPSSPMLPDVVKDPYPKLLKNWKASTKIIMEASQLRPNVVKYKTPTSMKYQVRSASAA